LCVIEGNARAVLAGERPALNAIQHLSGIATQTHDNVRRVRGSRTQIFDTRKTLPGWRLLQKYAVRRGGGANHRFSLKDAILIKENHLRISRLGKLGWMDAVNRARKRHKIPVQMEIQSERDLRDALRLRPDLVLLDNLPLRAMRRMIRLLRTRLPHVRIEVSGGVRTEDLKPLSRLNVERISMGRLTHTVPAFDCNLDIIRVDPK
jgi:nicotinate-nucleotide pyrophosphorylase (carboxylating)